MDYTYLASPYSHVDEAVRLKRYHEVAAYAGCLALLGEIVFCPITHSHQIGVAINRPVDHEFWLRLDTPFLVHSCRVKVLCLSGWRLSRGVAYEIELAQHLGIPVTYINEATYAARTEPKEAT
jgi:hypothetical protein